MVGKEETTETKRCGKDWKAMTRLDLMYSNNLYDLTPLAVLSVRRKVPF